MSDGVDPFGFGKFIPGFDFLQNLAQGAKADVNATAAAPQWLAFTSSVEEVDKRLQELRAVQFWLEQNSRALAATIQALEVQKMTLTALKSMPAGLGQWGAQPDPAQAQPGATTAPDPVQWWGALTEQFQQIAAKALQDLATQAGVQMAENFARSAMQAGAELNPAAAPSSAAAKPAAKPAAKKPAAKKSATAKKPATPPKTSKAAAKKPAAS